LFGFESKINYSTFDELFEKIINKDYNLRDLGENMFENKLESYIKNK